MRAGRPPAECPICAREIHTPPSTWTLFRLWRFARPYRWPLFWGFVLTLASTAATLVPPYLTMPLMDDVLIPYQNGPPSTATVVTMLLAGLLGAAAPRLGPGLGQDLHPGAGGERIGADLRTTTYRAPACSSRWSTSAASAPAT
jgi:ATP-binding cassette subfamily B protein